MKAYNLKAIKRTVADNVVSVLELGETGRGRKLLSVKCPEGIKDGDPVSIAKAPTNATITPKPKILCTDDGASDLWLARISTEGAYIRGAYGCVSYDPATIHKPTVVAKANGAFGEAGRTGTWYDYLLVVADETVLRVKPSRNDAYYLHFGADKVNRLTYDQLDLIDLTFNVGSKVKL